MKVVWLCYYPVMYFKEQIGKDQLCIDIKDISQHSTTWLYYLNHEIQKRNDVQLHLITSFPYLKTDIIIKENNITYYILRNNPGFNIVFGKYYSWLPQYFFNGYLVRKIKKIIVKINPDIINIHGTEHPYGLVTKKVNFPSLVWMQGVINLVIKTERNSQLKRMCKIEDKILNSQKYFITVKGNMEEEILKKNQDAKFFNLYYPISDSAFTLKNENLNLDCDVVYVGAVVKRKGIEDLIQAISYVIKYFPNIKVKVVGPYDLNYLEYLNQMIKERKLEENFRFTGFIPEHKDVLVEVKKSKIFVLPTHVDSGPRAVAESMAIGIPVISNNIDGLPSMINNNVNGILVEKGNIEMLANAISDLLNDDDKRKKLIEEAFSFAKGNFFAQTIVDKLFIIYKSILANKNSIYSK